MLQQGGLVSFRFSRVSMVLAPRQGGDKTAANRSEKPERGFWLGWACPGMYDAPRRLVRFTGRVS